MSLYLRKKPKQSFWDKVRDIPDANSKMDYYKRQEAARKNWHAPLKAPTRQTYEQQGVDRGIDRRSIANNPAQRAVVAATGLARPIVRGGNTLGGMVERGVEASIGLAQLGGESLLGTDGSYQAKLNSVNKSLERPLRFSDKGGLLGAGNHFNDITELHDKKKMAGGILASGGDLSSLIPVGGAYRLGYNTVGQVIKIPVKQTTKRVGGMAVVDGTANVVADSGTQLAETGRVDPTSLPLSFATGAALPFAAHGVGRVASKTTSSLQSPLRSVVDNVKTRSSRVKQSLAAKNQALGQAGGAMPDDTPTIKNLAGEEVPNPRYKGADAEDAATSYKAAQDAEHNKYKQSLGQRVKDKLVRELWDPRSWQHKNDKEWFKYKKSKGLVKDGIHELSPEESLATMRGRVENPGRPARIREKTKYKGYTVDDIVKHYGKENSQKSRDFELYRIFRDELERVNNGAKETIDATKEQMVEFISSYEKSNPLAKRHANSLRAMLLQVAKEKGKAGIDSDDLLGKLEGFKNYNPRKQIAPDDVVRPKVSEGLRTNTKGTQMRAVSSDGPVESPLSLTRELILSHEKDLATQKYGLLVRERTRAGKMGGAKEGIVAETVKLHKQFAQSVSDLREELQLSKRVTRSLSDKKRTTKYTAEKVKRLTKASEDKVVKRMRDLLDSARGNRANTLNDLVDRDPRYDIEAAKIKSQELPNLTKSERAGQIRADLKALGEKYPKPGDNTTRGDMLQLANALRKTDEALENGTETTSIRKGLSERLQKDYDDLEAMLRQSRENTKQIKADKADARKGFVDTTQRADTNTNVVKYKVDGEEGTIEIPIGMAKELEYANQVNSGGFLQRLAQGAGAVQKVSWTGPLQPSFKAINILVKNPTLMFFNADGLGGIRPEVAGSLVRQVFRTKKMVKFTKNMQKRGAAYENAMNTRNIVSSTTDDIAARANLKTFFARNPVSTVQDLWKGLGQGFAAFDNAQRTAVAYGAYKRAKGLGRSEAEALDIAARAPAKVFGDFDRISKLAIGMEAAVPYSGSIQAGTRAIGQSVAMKPGESAAKAGALAAGTIGFTLWSMSNNKEYYDDMVESDQEHKMDNSTTVVWPWAEKDKDTGEWSGVLHIPLVPDLRPANRALWRSTYDLVNKDGLDAGMIADNMLDQMTGDIGSSLYDSKKGEKATWNGVLAGSPGLNIGKTIAGIDTRDGDPLATPWQQTLPKQEQFNEYTSPGAMKASEVTKGFMSPQQFDQLFNSLGSAGDTLQNREDNNPLNPFVKPFKPGKTPTDKQVSGRQFYKNKGEAEDLLTSEASYNAFQSLYADRNGPLDDTKEKSYYDGSYKANVYLKHPDTLEASRKIDELGRKQGRPGDPMFDLDDNQIQTVLNLGALKVSPGNREAAAILEKNPWLKDYYKERGAFFDKVNASKSKEEKAAAGIDPMGMKIPIADKPMQAKLDKMNTITDKTEMATFYTENPDVNDYFAEQEKYNRAKRAFMGLPLFDKYPKADAETQKYLDVYNALPKGNGPAKKDGTASSPDRSAWIKAHPNEWAKMTDFFNTKAQYDLAKAGSLAVYEGIGFDEDDYDDIKSLASGGGSSYGGYGGYSGSGGGSSSKGYGSSNASDYSVSLNAGGSAKKASVKSFKTPTPTVNKKGKISQPKVSLKKAVV